MKQKLTLKTLLLAIAVIFASIVTNAQANVGIGTPTPDASAKLDVTSTNQGILVPRMTTTARTGIAVPAKGLMVYDSTIKAFYYHDGTNWGAVGGAGGGASLQLVATNTSNAQTLSNANGTNTGDLLTFNNVVTTPISVHIILDQMPILQQLQGYIMYKHQQGLLIMQHQLIH